MDQVDNCFVLRKDIQSRIEIFLRIICYKVNHVYYIIYMLFNLIKLFSIK